jgi:hypothetical protein
MVYIAQCLCPRRHCILALAYESRAGETGEQAEATAKKLLDIKTWLDPWCGLCQEKRPRWHVEVKATAWQTMEEARRAGIYAAEAEQQASAAAIKAAQKGAKN